MSKPKSLDEEFDAAPSLDEEFDKTPLRFGANPDPEAGPEGEGQYVGPASNSLDTVMGALAPEKPAGAALQAVTDTASMGFGDEVGAGLATGLEGARRVFGAGSSDKPLGDVYRQERDERQAMDEKAAKAQPGVYGATALGTALAMPIKGAKGATLGAKMMSGAGQALKMAAPMAAGHSKADLTKGNLRGLLSDVEDTSAMSLPFGAAGGAFSHIAEKLGARLGAKAAQVKADRAAKDLAEELARVKSLQSGAASATQKGARALENMEREVGNVSVPLGARVGNFLDSPEARALREQVVRNNLENAPQTLSDMIAKKAEAAAAATAAPSAAAQKTADYFAKSPLKTEVTPRLAHHFNRIVPPVLGVGAGGLIGNALDLGPGATTGLGAALAGGLSAVTGHPGTAFKNMMRSPRFQVGANQAGQALMSKASGGSERALRAAIQAYLDKQDKDGGQP